MPSRSRVSWSSEGFYPKRWGPPLWTFLHIIALNYPTKPSISKRRAYEAFFDGLKDILPCQRCRQNYKRHMLPKSAFSGRAALFRAVYDLHTTVSRELKKRARAPSYSAVVRRYESMRYRRSQSRPLR